MPLRQGSEKGSGTAPVADGRKGAAAIPAPRWNLQSIAAAHDDNDNDDDDADDGGWWLSAS